MHTEAALAVVLSLLIGGCTSDAPPEIISPAHAGIMTEETFAEAVAFLEAHTDVLVLEDESGGRVAVAPDMQGRVMTSSVAGPDGLSLGWINRELIASGDTLEHMNPYGGEDRFWIGPEGGQFAVFFAPGDPFDLEHWQTPAAIDTEAFELVSSDDRHARFEKDMRLENYSGATFDLRVDRDIRLLDRSAAGELLGVDPSQEVRMVAFASENTITNTGDRAWREETGLLSIWILGMFNPSPATTVVVPYVEGPEQNLGPIVNDDYFGDVPPERLRFGDRVLFFSGDGMYRSKIGLTPGRARDVLGSYDAVNGVLTIVQYTKPEDATRYVNSMWKILGDPYHGDVVNSYNDGPPEPGAAPLGPFYELETSSPAAALAPAESLTHVHRTFHFQGPDEELDRISRTVLGVGLEAIRDAL